VFLTLEANLNFNEETFGASEARLSADFWGFISISSFFPFAGEAPPEKSANGGSGSSNINEETDEDEDDDEEEEEETVEPAARIGRSKSFLRGRVRCQRGFSYSLHLENRSSTFPARKVEYSVRPMAEGESIEEGEEAAADAGEWGEGDRAARIADLIRFVGEITAADPVPAPFGGKKLAIAPSLAEKVNGEAAAKKAEATTKQEGEEAEKEKESKACS